MREQRVLNYGGRIRPGMGVQRRHSAGSLAKTELNLYDGKEYSGLMISPQVQWNNKAVRDRFRRPSMIVMGVIQYWNFRLETDETDVRRRG
jgi:hypothetical protein